MSRFIVFDHDPEPDFSWLEQDHLKPGHKDYSPCYRTGADMRAKRNPVDPDWYRDPENHVALCMLVYEQQTAGPDQVVNSLGNIDFIEPWNDWTTGTFYFVNDIPKRCRYQRSLARDAGLRYRPRRKVAA